MGLLQNIFRNKELPLTSYEDFWNWFLKNEKQFFRVIKDNKRIEEDFAQRFFPKLRELNKGFFYLVGMYDENTAELIFSADIRYMHCFLNRRNTRAIYSIKTANK